MRAKVLKSFLYAHDGLSTVALSVNSEVDIQDAVARGLIAEGYISEIDIAELVDTTEEEPSAETGELHLVEETADKSPAPENGDGEAVPENKEMNPKRRGRG